MQAGVVHGRGRRIEVQEGIEQDRAAAVLRVRIDGADSQIDQRPAAVQAGDLRAGKVRAGNRLPQDRPGEACRPDANV